MNVSDARDVGCTLYAGELAPQADVATLRELFTQAGRVVDVKLPRDRVSGEHQGFAFIVFATPEDTRYALQVMQGTALYGRRMRLRLSTRGETQPS